MPAGGEATISAARTIHSPAEVSTSTVAFSDYEFVQGLGLNDVRDFVFDPSDSLTMYVATVSGVQVSTDGGRTSMPLGTGLTEEVRALAVTESAGQPILLASTMFGLFRYELNTGNSSAWSQLSGTVLPSTTLTLATRGATVYAAGWSNADQTDILYKSLDGGVSWNATTFSSRDIGKIWLVDNDRLYVSHRDGLAYSTDGGATWEERGVELLKHDNNDGVLVGGLVFDPSNPAVMLVGLKEAMISGNALFRTADGGVTWEPVWGLDDVSKVFAMAADPDRAEVVYLLAGYGLWKSADRGATWWKIGNGLPSGATFYTVGVSPFDTNSIFTGLNYGIYASKIIVPPPAVFEVGPSGCDFVSIQEAFDASRSGDTILVHPGTYLENVVFDSGGITLRSVDGPRETVIDGNNSGPAVSFVNCDEASVLEGFTLLHGAAADGHDGGGIYCENADLLIKNCIISDNYADHCGGGVYLDGTAAKIVNCRISGNQASAAGSAVYADSLSDLTMVNTVVSRNLPSTDEVENAAIVLSSQSHADLTHCTIADNEVGGFFVDADAQLEIFNSIIWGNGDEPSDQLLVNPPDSTAVVEVSSCDVEGGYAGTANINLNPLFAFGPDYALSAASPCIGMADLALLPLDGFDLDEDEDVDELLPLDIDGQARVNGPAPDMGADEFFSQGLWAQYSNGIKTSELKLYSGYSGDCAAPDNNLYQGMCVPVAESPVDWGWGSFAVEWSGYLLAPVDGVYSFSSHFWVDGTVFVKVGDTVIADFDTGGGGYSGQVELQANSYVPVTISFATNGGSNNFSFGWTLPGQSWELVPAQYLFPEIYDFDHDFDVDGQDLADSAGVLEFGLAGFAEKFGLPGVR
jgi:hypothetical protein